MLKDFINYIDDLIYQMASSRYAVVRAVGFMAFVLVIMMGISLAITLMLLPVIHPMLGFITVFGLLALIASEVLD